jgi:16S rRNA C967 or C1407 C5-methylase (RsmB/RsmF family)
MNTQRIINAALDCITQFEAQRFPLKNVAHDVIVQRQLNSRERRVFLDVLFRWSREINLLKLFIREKFPYAQSVSSQQKNALALKIVANLVGLSLNDDAHDSFAFDYEQWCQKLSTERNLLALGKPLMDLLMADYAHDAVAIAEGLLKRPAKYFAVDQTKITVLQLCNALQHMGISFFCHAIAPCAVGTYDDISQNDLPKEIRDAVWFMDAGSQIIAELINPKPQEHVLDLCVGEGNKAYYITMKECHYTAVDSDGRRLKRAKSRLTHRQVKFFEADGRNPPLAEESFDWVLLDAPCSGIGVLRRHPDLIHRLSLKDISGYIELQRSLLESAVNLLKPGGILIYATCSLLLAENEQQIHYILSKNDKIMPMTIGDLVGEHLKFNSGDLNKYCLTLYPHIDDCDGFFFAVLRKRLGHEAKRID